MADQKHPEFAIERYTDMDVLGLLDQLIAHHEAAPGQRRAVEEWMGNNPPPEQPESFGGMRELMDYSAAKAKHERALIELRQMRDAHEQSYRERARLVAEILPEGVPLIHERPPGTRYEIVRQPAEGAGDFGEQAPLPVSVRKLD